MIWSVTTTSANRAIASKQTRMAARPATQVRMDCTLPRAVIPMTLFVRRASPCPPHSRPFSIYSSAKGTPFIRKVSGEELRHKEFEVLKFSQDGTFHRHSVNMREILKLLPPGIRFRDLRGTHGRQISQILVREDHYWITAENIMAVVTAEDAIVFRADTKSVQDFSVMLSDTLSLNSRINKQGLKSDTFELVVLEEILSAVVREFDHKLNLLIPVVKGILQSFTSDPANTDDTVVRMIPMSNTLTNFHTSLVEFRSAIEDVLESENDLSHLCLSRKDKSTRTEVEMVLENYSKKAEELVNEVQEILSNINNTKKAIEMTMSSTRNQLMRMNLHISLMSLTLSSAAVTSSIFGMNLLSGLETHPYMFYYVVFFLPIFGTAIYSTYHWYYLGKKRRLVELTHLSFATSNFFDKITCIDDMKNLESESPEEFRSILQKAMGTDISQDHANIIFSAFKGVSPKSEEVTLEEEEGDIGVNLGDRGITI